MDLGAVGDLREGLTGKLLWWLVDHETMDGKAFKEVKDCFAELVEGTEEHISLGLDLDLCLMIDKESVDRLLDRDETSIALLAPEKEKAFVWGVDVNCDDNDDEEGDEYSGHFKISVSVLMLELWHTSDTQSPDKLYPSKGQIYQGIVGNVAEAIAAATMAK
jgi:hypothetical protein